MAFAGCGGGSGSSGVVSGGGGNPPPAPSITSISPTSGPVGTAVTISGANFGSTQGTSTVSFAGTAATATSWNSTTIATTVPSGAATGNVVVTVSGTASNGLSFTVTAPAKTVASVSVSCSPTTLQLVASGVQPTSQCTATVNYSDGTSDHAASYAVSPTSAGTITSAGLFTPSSSLTAVTTASVTATAAADASKTSAPASITINPVAAKTVTSVAVACNPTTLQLVASGTQPTSQCTATVNYSDGTSDHAASYAVSPTSAGTITSAGLFTPSSSITTATQAGITASAGGKTSSSAIVTIDPVAATMPTVTLTCPSASVAFGGSMTCPITYTGSPSPTLSCAVSGTGTCSVAGSGSSLAYNLPNPASTTPPSSYEDTITLTATNAAGSATAQATVDLVPSITSATIQGSSDPSMVSGGGKFTSYNVNIVGMGFFTNTVVNTDTACAFIPAIQDTSHITIAVSCGDSYGQYQPGPFHFWFMEPSPGGGSSNKANLVFAGNLNNLTVLTKNGVDQEAYFLDQGPYPRVDNDIIWQYQLSSGIAAANGSCGSGVGTSSIAVDDKTGYLVIAYDGLGGYAIADPNAVSPFPPDCAPAPIGSGGGTEAVIDASAKNGYVFGSQNTSGGNVDSFSLTQANTFATLPIGVLPWETALGTLSNQLTGITFDASTLKLIAVSVPMPSSGAAPLWTIPLSGFTPASAIQTPPNGGWPLAVSWTDGMAAVLSRYDGKIDLVDLSTQQLTSAAIPGHILRMAADPVNHRFIVAEADVQHETGTFLAVDYTGNVTTLQSVAPHYCTGLGVSADGQWLYCGVPSGNGAPYFEVLPDQ